MSLQPRLIGVDWGTSNLRVMRIAEGGRVLESRSDPRGAGRLTPEAFAPILQAVAGDWLDPALPVFVCGMAGAPGRWLDAGFLPCPAGADEIIAGLKRPDPDGPFIIPAVAMVDEAGLQDVMRGEETQILGLIGAEAVAPVIVAPGTHSKWVRMDGARIRDFRTFMTGELFSALRAGTVLGVGMGDPGGDDAAFRRGVERGLATSAASADLFSVRIEMLAGRVPLSGTADYMSGLLIGLEIAAQPRSSLAGDISIVGADRLTIRYQQALALAGCATVRRHSAEDATARGLWRIYEAFSQ